MMVLAVLAHKPSKSLADAKLNLRPFAAANFSPKDHRRLVEYFPNKFLAVVPGSLES
jgi:hypothetical protein